MNLFNNNERKNDFSKNLRIKPDDYHIKSTSHIHYQLAEINFDIGCYHQYIQKLLVANKVDKFYFLELTAE